MVAKKENENKKQKQLPACVFFKFAFFATV